MSDERISIRDDMKTTVKANYSISWPRQRTAQKEERNKRKY